jgi:hypothetical protein
MSRARMRAAVERKRITAAALTTSKTVIHTKAR